MTFLNPLLLLAGLGVALPILAHLLNRYRVKHTPWAAMQFLDRSVRVRSRQLRLQDLLLLVLRCLAILLLALAFARPGTRATDGSWLPGERRAGVVIVLDASFSMQHREGDATRFERALGLIDVIADQVHPGDPVSLVLLDREPRVVLRNMAFNRERFREVLFSQKVSAEPLNLDGIAKRLGELVQGMVANQKEIYIVTDFQSRDWAPGAYRLQDNLDFLSDEAVVFMVPVSGAPDNLAVTHLEFVSGTLRRGASARYRATVRNCGQNPVSDIEVLCRVDGVQIDSKRIPSIPPGAAETVSLFVPFHNSGALQITAEISGDSLPTDNLRRVVAKVRERVSVVCIDGSPGDAGRLIVSALLAREDGGADEDYLVKSVPWLALPEQDLAGVDVVVLANVPEITSAQADRLARYVRQGNGLVWFGGDQVKAARWNEQSTGQAAGRGEPGHALLPAAIGQAVDCADSLGAGKPFDPAMTDHVLCRPLQSLPEDLFSETRFLKHLEVEPAATGFPVLRLAGTGAPILLEHSLGRGKVVMFTTSAEASWNNLALTPVFPMLMQQIIHYLAGREYESPRIVGDSLSLAYTEQPDASNAVFVTPSGETLTVPVRKYRNQYVAMLESSQEAGFYEARVSVQSPGTPIAVNVDTRESTVSCLSESELAANLEGSNVTLVAKEQDLVSSIEASRTSKSSWRFFMMACLLVLLIESLVADRQLSRQRSTKSGSGSSASETEVSQDD